MTINKLGRYDLIRVLGKGAMGLVYEGRDPNLDRRVAIKTIKVENLSDEAAAEYEVRFRTEARSAARLQHPHIVSVYDSDRDGDIAYLVMELIQGDDLKHHMDLGDRYTLQETLRIICDLLSALDYAHRQNIVHRDIKPANLLIEASGRVKLTDFGVARIQDSGDATRTRGTMVGTLKYMSPEQVQGLPIDSRADLFATGVVLYQLLTGQRPFDGDSDFAIIQQIVAHDPAPVSSINPSLPVAMDAVLARALAKQREQRFASGHEFAAALQAAAGQASDPTVVAPPADRAIAKSSTWTGTVRAGESLVDTHGGTGGSIVTQELELVYWKDVKDSSDVEDLQGFLARFPAGIYSDLARRRLRKLGFRMADDSSASSLSGTRQLIDKTMRMPSATSGSGRVPTDAAGAGTETLRMMPPVAAPTPSSGSQASPPGFGQSTRPPAPIAANASSEPLAPIASSAAHAIAPLATTERPLQLPSAVPVPAISTVAAANATAGPSNEPLPASSNKDASAPGADGPASDTKSSGDASQEPLPASPEPADVSIPPTRRPMAWLLAGIVVLAGVGLWWNQASGPAAPALDASAPLPALPASSAASSALPAGSPGAASTAALEAQAGNKVPSAAVSSAAPSNPSPLAGGQGGAKPASAALAVTAPAHAGSAPAAHAKANIASKVAPAAAAAAADKDKESSAVKAPAAKPADAAPPLATARPRVEPSASRNAVAVASNPRDACEGKSLFSFQTCMNEQCAKPAFANAPECLERKAIEKRRRDVDQTRN
ncbi:MAG: protein kinase [Burkholderiaceae bacterium]